MNIQRESREASREAVRSSTNVGGASDFMKLECGSRSHIGRPAPPIDMYNRWHVMIQSKGLLVFAGVAFILFGIALVWCVVSMLKSNRTDILASAPLAVEQEIQIPYTSKARILLETPRTSSEYSNLRIELIERQTGRSVTGAYSFVTAQGAVYGVTTMQVPFGPEMSLPAGVYLARISGLQAGNDYSRYRLLISRPYIGRLTLQIIALVLCGVAMMLDLVWAAWLAGLMKPADQPGAGLSNRSRTLAAITSGK